MSTSVLSGSLALFYPLSRFDRRTYVIDLFRLQRQLYYFKTQRLVFPYAFFACDVVLSFFDRFFLVAPRGGAFLARRVAHLFMLCCMGTEFFPSPSFFPSFFFSLGVPYPFFFFFSTSFPRVHSLTIAFRCFITVYFRFFRWAVRVLFGPSGFTWAASPSFLFCFSLSFFFLCPLFLGDGYPREGGSFAAFFSPSFNRLWCLFLAGARPSSSPLLVYFAPRFWCNSPPPAFFCHCVA